jgi:hypothetical protein
LRDKEKGTVCPHRLRYSLGATGLWVAPPLPLAPPSIAGILRGSEPSCRAGFASRRRGKCCESGERSKYREAQGTRASGQVVGAAFLLGTFLWRRKEKYLARTGETINYQQQKTIWAPGNAHPRWPSARDHQSQPVRTQHHCCAPQDPPRRHANVPATPIPLRTRPE